MILDAFKVISSQYPIKYVNSCYTISSLNTSRLLTTRSRLSSLAWSFHYMIPTLWNSFKSVNNITNFSLCSLKTFKKSLKSFLLCMQNSFGESVWHSFNNNLVEYCNYMKIQCMELAEDQPRVNHQPGSGTTLVFPRIIWVGCFPMLSVVNLLIILHICRSFSHFILLVFWVFFLFPGILCFLLLLLCSLNVLAHSFPLFLTLILSHFFFTSFVY